MATIPEPSSSRLRFARDFEPGAVVRDHLDEESGLRFFVVRGPYSFCAYVGVEASHALASLEELNFRCHRGITFQGWGDGESPPLPVGWYFWGWDYSHPLTDRLTILTEQERAQLAEEDPDLERLLRAMQKAFPEGKDWTVDEVAEEALDVLFELKQQLAESEQFAVLLARR